MLFYLQDELVDSEQQVDVAEEREISQSVEGDNTQASGGITGEKLEVKSEDVSIAAGRNNQLRQENTGTEVHEVPDDANIRFRLPNSSLGIP